MQYQRAIMGNIIITGYAEETIIQRKNNLQLNAVILR
jgi:hypothetical protein